MAHDFFLPQNRKVQEGSGLNLVHPVGVLRNRFENLKFETLVVRSQAGSDPKPKVKSKSINFPKDYGELVEQVSSSTSFRLVLLFVSLSSNHLFWNCLNNAMCILELPGRNIRP